MTFYRPLTAIFSVFLLLLCLEELTWKVYFLVVLKQDSSQKKKKKHCSFFFFAIQPKNIFKFLVVFFFFFSFCPFVLHLAGMGMFYILASSLVIVLYEKHVDINYLLPYISGVLLHALVKYLLK